jgi:hypothetical protein
MYNVHVHVHVGGLACLRRESVFDGHGLGEKLLAVLALQIPQYLKEARANERGALRTAR